MLTKKMVTNRIWCERHDYDNLPPMADEHPTQSTLQEHYAGWLRELREVAGFTQQALAKQMGAHRSFVSHIESGKRVISIDTLGQFRSILLSGENELPPYRERVAARLQAARLRVSPRLSQESLSELAGCSVGYVAKVESAAVNTTIERIERLATSLGIPAAELLDD